MFKFIIKEIQAQDQLARSVDKGLAVINSSHTVTDLDPHTRRALRMVVIEQYGSNLWDWIECFLYERSGDKLSGVMCHKDGKDYTINTPDQLYSFIYD